MPNWRRNPEAERHAMHDWIESTKIDLIEADLLSTSTPPPPIVANSRAS
jgi:hypothetical protein